MEYHCLVPQRQSRDVSCIGTGNSLLSSRRIGGVSFRTVTRWKCLARYFYSLYWKRNAFLETVEGRALHDKELAVP